MFDLVQVIFIKLMTIPISDDNLQDARKGDVFEKEE